MEVIRAPFGMLDGEPVELITLRNGAMEARILTYGAGIQALLVPDRVGTPVDVVLGHATLQDYLDHPQYLGATVGRVANRIAGGRFTLDGAPVEVTVNDGANALHGGVRGFDKANWRVLAVEEDGRAGVTLGHVSPHGDQGYPGTLTVTATYVLEDDASLSIDYRAATDRPTIVNISNHAYWNLGGEGSAGGAMDHILTIPADHFLPVTPDLIPTGEYRAVAGTAFDFRQPTPIGLRVRDGVDEQIRNGRGYDHNWVVAREAAEEPRLLARLVSPATGCAMEIFSNQPGLQFYSGNVLDGTTSGKSGRFYRMGDGIALEPQAFPDTPNRPDFGSIRLAPGETYRNRIIWRFFRALAEKS